MDKNTGIGAAAFALLVAGIAGCAATAQAPRADADREALAVMQRDFKGHGQATADRLKQDAVQALCTKYPGGAGLPSEEAKRVEAEQLAAVKYPADGRYLGDWKTGEQIAQTGVGKQWSDDPAKPSGGNCYACHQLSPQELSFGTIGPSLLHYGKLRGNSPEIQRYTYAKVFNAEAFNACSSMPRFGHSGILTEKQIKDVVALLLDPSSPVNK